MWIRGAFLAHEGLLRKGHRARPYTDRRGRGPANRVNVDTGAFHTGRLSALVIDGAERRVLTVSEKGQRASVTTP